MKKIKFTTLLLAITAMVSCQKESIDTNYNDSSMVKFTAGVGSSFTRSNPVDDDASAAFKTGDVICVSAETQTGINYTLSEVGWAPAETDKFLKWDKTAMTFKAYYPVGVNGASMTTFNLPADQTTLDKIEKADYMTYTSPAPEAKAESIALELGRKMSRIVISTTFNDQYATGYTIDKIEVSGNTSGYENSVVKSGDITVSTLSSAGKFYALLCPTTADGDKTFFTITVKKTADETTETLTVKGIPSLAAGNSYSYSVLVGKNEIKIVNVTVSNWATGVAIGGGEANRADKWDGTYATKLSGFGSKESPYLITNAKELALMSTGYCNENAPVSRYKSYYKLMADIDLGYREWIPIGSNYNVETGKLSSNTQNSFTGAFDGNGHTIYGLKVTATDTMVNVGLFGRIAPAYEDDTCPNIQNLKIKDAKIYVGITFASEMAGFGSSSGILVGYVSGGTVGAGSQQTAKIINCHVTGEIFEVPGATIISGIGGLVGQSQLSVIEDCTSDVEITTTNGKFIGGLVGNAMISFIGYSHSKGSITGTYTLGGLCGSADVSVIGVTDMFINFCTASVNITATDWNVGGFTGYSNASIINCSASGNVTSTINWPKHFYKTGGFTGTNGGTIQNCVYSGTLTGGDNSENWGVYYGGFVGNHNKGKTIHCRFDGAKNPNLSEDGLSAFNEDFTTLYTDNDISNVLR